MTPKEALRSLPVAVARAEKLRLVMTGWLSWSDSTANMAAAGQGIDFVPPTFEVPDGRGGWRVAGPPVGFPSGKTKTMVVDVASVLPRDDPRIRVATNLRLYWDEIVLAVDDDDAPRDVRTLEAPSARIWRRGFSAPLDGGGLGRAHHLAGAAADAGLVHHRRRLRRVVRGGVREMAARQIRRGDAPPVLAGCRAFAGWNRHQPDRLPGAGFAMSNERGMRELPHGKRLPERAPG